MIDVRNPRVMEQLLGRPAPSVLTPIDREMMREQSASTALLKEPRTK